MDSANFLEHLKDASLNPLAFVAYAIIVFAAVLTYLRKAKFDSVQAELKDLRPEDKANFLRRRYGLSDSNIKPEQWLKGKRQGMFLSAYIATLLAVIMFVAIFFFTHSGKEEKKTYSYTFYVVDAEEPHDSLASAIVRLPDNAAFKGITGNDGMVRFENLPTPEFNIHVEKTGYASFDGGCAIVNKGGSRTFRLKRHIIKDSQHTNGSKNNSGIGVIAIHNRPVVSETFNLTLHLNDFLADATVYLDGKFVPTKKDRVKSIKVSKSNPAHHIVINGTTEKDSVDIDNDDRDIYLNNMYRKGI